MPAPCMPGYRPTRGMSAWLPRLRWPLCRRACCSAFASTALLSESSTWRMRPHFSWSWRQCLSAGAPAAPCANAAPGAQATGLHMEVVPASQHSFAVSQRSTSPAPGERAYTGLSKGIGALKRDSARNSAMSCLASNCHCERHALGKAVGTGQGTRWLHIQQRQDGHLPHARLQPAVGLQRAQHVLPVPLLRQAQQRVGRGLQARASCNQGAALQWPPCGQARARQLRPGEPAPGPGLPTAHCLQRRCWHTPASRRSHCHVKRPLLQATFQEC